MAKKFVVTRKPKKNRKVVAPRTKTVSKRTPTPLTEEDFEDYSGWKYIFFAGTDLASNFNAAKQSWNFNKFSDDLEEDGYISSMVAQGYHAYVFGGIEPTSLHRLDGKTFKVTRLDKKGKKKIVSETTETIVPVPHIDVVFTKSALPSIYGVTSIQMDSDVDKVDFKSLRLAWAPFAEYDHENDLPSKKAPSRPIYYLETSLRKNAIRELSADKAARYEYGNPWVPRPKIIESEIEDTLETLKMSNIITIEPQQIGEATVDCSFDRANETREEIINRIIGDNKLEDTEEVRATVLEIITKASKAKKEQDDLKIAKMRESIENLSETDRVNFDEIIVAKYYPTHSKGRYDITVALNKRVNRFVGDADKVFHGESECCTAAVDVVGMFA